MNLRGSKTFITGLEQENMGGVGRRKKKRKMMQLYFSKNIHMFPINTLLSFPLLPFSLSFFPPPCCLHWFVSWFHYVSQTELEFMILQPQFSECLDYMQVRPSPSIVFFLLLNVTRESVYLVEVLLGKKGEISGRKQEMLLRKCDQNVIKIINICEKYHDEHINNAQLVYDNEELFKIH